MDKNVQQTAQLEHTEMTLPTHVQIVTTHACAVLMVLLLDVDVVTRILICMKENVELFAQEEPGQTLIHGLVTIVTEAVSLVPEDPNMIVKNHAQKVFIGIMDSVSLLAHLEPMKMMPISKLVNHAT